jgi:hypothetical protein
VIRIPEPATDLQPLTLDQVSPTKHQAHRPHRPNRLKSSAMALTLLIESTGQMPTLEDNLLIVPPGQKARLRLIKSDAAILTQQIISENDDTKILIDQQIQEAADELRIRLKDIYHQADHILIRLIPAP